jgi:hypothetical protein
MNLVKLFTMNFLLSSVVLASGAESTNPYPDAVNLGFVVEVRGNGLNSHEISYYSSTNEWGVGFVISDDDSKTAYISDSNGVPIVTVVKDKHGEISSYVAKADVPYLRSDKKLAPNNFFESLKNNQEALKFANNQGFFTKSKPGQHIEFLNAVAKAINIPQNVMAKMMFWVNKLQATSPAAPAPIQPSQNQGARNAPPPLPTTPPPPLLPNLPQSSPGSPSSMRNGASYASSYPSPSSSSSASPYSQNQGREGARNAPPPLPTNPPPPPSSPPPPPPSNSPPPPPSSSQSPSGPSSWIGHGVQGNPNPQVSPERDIQPLIRYIKTPTFGEGTDHNGRSRAEHYLNVTRFLNEKYRQRRSLQSRMIQPPFQGFDADPNRGDLFGALFSEPDIYPAGVIPLLGGQNHNDLENKIMKDYLSSFSPPTPWSIQDIDNAYNSLVRNAPPPHGSQANITVVTGLGVSGLHKLPLGKNAILQIASQFNYLESPGNYITPVWQYPNDRTQGPIASLEAIVSAVHRRACIENGTLNDALHNVLLKDSYYQNGYLELLKMSPREREEFLQHLQKGSIKQLEILPTWVMCESSMTPQIQVFSAAPSFQNLPSPPHFNSVEGQIANLLVKGQYEAIAKLAVIKSLSNGGEFVPLHLTLVGQGVFKNPKEVMRDAMQAVENAVKGFNVHVYIHIFSATEAPEFVTRIALQTQPRIMTKEAFVQWQMSWK